MQCLDERPPCLWSSISFQPLFEYLCNNHLWVVATDTLDVINLIAIIIEKKCSELSVMNSNFRRDVQLKEIRKMWKCIHGNDWSIGGCRFTGGLCCSRYLCVNTQPHHVLVTGFPDTIASLGAAKIVLFHSCEVASRMRLELRLAWAQDGW